MRSGRNRPALSTRKGDAMAPSLEFTCPHCNARPGQNEIDDGWCDSCGKRLPSWVSAKSTRLTSSPVSESDVGTRPRLFLWAAGACTICGLAAAAVALAAGG